MCRPASSAAPFPRKSEHEGGQRARWKAAGLRRGLATSTMFSGVRSVVQGVQSSKRDHVGRDSSTGWKHVCTQGPGFNPCQLKSLWSTARNTTACANPNPNYNKNCTQRRVPFKFPETQDRTGMYVGQTQTGPMFSTTEEQVSIITLLILLNMLVTECLLKALKSRGRIDNTPGRGLSLHIADLGSIHSIL